MNRSIQPGAVRRPDRPHRRGLAGAAVLWALLLGLAPAQAALDINMDAATLNELLGAVAVYEVEVPLAQGKTLRVLLDQARVLGFEPDGGDNGQVLTSVRIQAPLLGLVLRVEPRLSLSVIEQGKTSYLELRFDEVPLALPLGSIDLAAMLQPLRYPADSLFLIAGAQDDVEVRSRVTGVEMSRERLRFEVTLEARPNSPTTP